MRFESTPARSCKTRHQAGFVPATPPSWEMMLIVPFSGSFSGSRRSRTEPHHQDLMVRLSWHRAQILEWCELPRTHVLGKKRKHFLKVQYPNTLLAICSIVALVRHYLAHRMLDRFTQQTVKGRKREQLVELMCKKLLLTTPHGAWRSVRLYRCVVGNICWITKLDPVPPGGGLTLTAVAQECQKTSVLGREINVCSTSGAVLLVGN